VRELVSQQSAALVRLLGEAARTKYDVVTQWFVEDEVSGGSSVWDQTLVWARQRFSTWPPSESCVGYAVYVSAAERRSILLKPPRWPPMWWLALPTVACVGSWFVVILLVGNFGVTPLVLLAGGIAVFDGAARQIRDPSIRVVVEAVAGAVAVVGLDGTLGLGVPVFALLFSLAVTCAVAAVCLALMRIVCRSPKSAPA
jgi:hypothetical protein